MDDHHQCACCGAAIESDCGLPELCETCRAWVRPIAGEADPDRPVASLRCPDRQWLREHGG